MTYKLSPSHAPFDRPWHMVLPKYKHLWLCASFCALFASGCTSFIPEPESETIHDAILNGEYEDVRRFVLRNPAVVNEYDGKGTPLGYAFTVAFDYKLIKFLLDHGADVDTHPVWNELGLANEYMHPLAGSMKGVPVVVHAATYDSFVKNSGLTKLLVRHGASINRSTVNGFTPLHAAAAFGSVELGKWLVANGADLHARCSMHDLGCSNVTPLHLAALNYHSEMVELLIKSGADPNAFGNYNGDTYWVDLPVIHMVIVKKPEHSEGQDIDADVVDQLIRLGAKTDFKSNPWGIGEDTEEYLPMTLALKEKKGPIVRVLMKHGVKFSPEYIRKVSYFDLKSLRELVKNGMDVNSKDDLGNTFLHYAATYHELGKIQYLIDSGANLNIKNKKGFTVLDIAEKCAPELLKGQKTIGKNIGIAIFGEPGVLGVLEKYGLVAGWPEDAKAERPDSKEFDEKVKVEEEEIKKVIGLLRANGALRGVDIE